MQKDYYGDRPNLNWVAFLINWKAKGHDCVRPRIKSSFPACALWKKHV